MFFLAPLLGAAGGIASLFGGAVTAAGSLIGGAASAIGSLGAGAVSTIGTIGAGTLKLGAGTIKTAGALGTGAIKTTGEVVGGAAKVLPTLPEIIGQAGQAYQQFQSIFDKPEQPVESPPIIIQQPAQQPLMGQLSDILSAIMPAQKEQFLPIYTTTPPAETKQMDLILYAGLGLVAYLLLKKK